MNPKLYFQLHDLAQSYCAPLQYVEDRATGERGPTLDGVPIVASGHIALDEGDGNTSVFLARVGTSEKDPAKIGGVVRVHRGPFHGQGRTVLPTNGRPRPLDRRGLDGHRLRELLALVRRGPSRREAPMKRLDGHDCGCGGTPGEAAGLPRHLNDAVRRGFEVDVQGRRVDPRKKREKCRCEEAKKKTASAVKAVKKAAAPKIKAVKKKTAAVTAKMKKTAVRVAEDAKEAAAPVVKKARRATGNALISAGKAIR